VTCPFSVASVADLLYLYEAGGDGSYGEDATLPAPSLQTAARASEDSARGL
jgi:hypothetical protein